MVGWFKAHVFIAAWASPLIALIGLLFRKSQSGASPLDWSRIMVCVGFLTALAIVVTPGLDTKTYELGRALAGFGFGSMLFLAMRQ